MPLFKKNTLFISDQKIRKRRRSIGIMFKYVSFAFTLLFLVFGVGVFFEVSNTINENTRRQELLVKIRTLPIPQNLKDVYAFLLEKNLFEVRTIVYNFVIVKVESNFKEKALNYNRSSGTRDIGYSQINENTYRTYKNNFIKFVIERIYPVDFSKSLDILFKVDDVSDPYVNIIFSCYYIEYVVYPRIRERGEEVTIEKVLSMYNSNRLFPTNPITKRYIKNAITFMKNDGRFVSSFVD